MREVHSSRQPETPSVPFAPPQPAQAAPVEAKVPTKPTDLRVGMQWKETSGKGRTWEIVERLPFGKFRVKQVGRAYFGEIPGRGILSDFAKGSIAPIQPETPEHFSASIEQVIAMSEELLAV